MSPNDAQMVAARMVSLHGKGASLLAYQQVARTMRELDRLTAEAWCRVLVEIEAILNREWRALDQPLVGGHREPIAP